MLCFSYKTVVRPSYKVVYRTVTSLEWKCCPGFRGAACEEGESRQMETQVLCQFSLSLPFLFYCSSCLHSFTSTYITVLWFVASVHSTLKQEWFLLGLNKAASVVYVTLGIKWLSLRRVSQFTSTLFIYSYSGDVLRKGCFWVLWSSWNPVFISLKCHGSTSVFIFQLQ